MPILFNASIVNVIGDREGVTGARITVGGKDMLVTARKGVVLATGGYAHNTQFRKTFMPQPVPAHSLSYEGNRGDGVYIGQSLGARVAAEAHPAGYGRPCRSPRGRTAARGCFRISCSTAPSPA